LDEVAGPFGGAHALHGAGRLVAPVATVLGDHRPPHLVPGLLGVDQHPIQIEDHRIHVALPLFGVEINTVSLRLPSSLPQAAASTMPAPTVAPSAGSSSRKPPVARLSA